MARVVKPRTFPVAVNLAAGIAVADDLALGEQTSEAEGPETSCERLTMGCIRKEMIEDSLAAGLTGQRTRQEAVCWNVSTYNGLAAPSMMDFSNTSSFVVDLNPSLSSNASITDPQDEPIAVSPDSCHRQWPTKLTHLRCRRSKRDRVLCSESRRRGPLGRTEETAKPAAPISSRHRPPPACAGIGACGVGDTLWSG